MTLDLSSLRRAVASLERAIAVCQDASFFSHLNTDQQNTLRAGVIQNFEFTYELCWKFMKRWIENNVSPFKGEGIARRELFRMAAENGLIVNIDEWMDFHEARNATSHSYDQQVATRVAEMAIRFLPRARELLDAIDKRNA